MTSAPDVELPNPRSGRPSKDVLILVVATLLALVPFINKPFHIDDPLFVWGARHLSEHFPSQPFDFFGFDVLWSIRYKPMHQVMQNPPGAIYFLAGAACVGGWSETWLHTACLLPALGLVLGTWRLARGLTRRPLFAGLSVLCTPVFLVSSTNVMCDTLMVCFWIWSVVFWREGLLLGSPRKLFAGALLIGIAILAKYFAAALIPLLALYTIAHQRRITGPLLWLAIPCGMLAGFQLWTKQLYGHALFTTAAEFARESYQRAAPAWTMKLFGILTFTGACLLCLLFTIYRWGRWRMTLIGAGLTALLAGMLMVFQPTFLQPDGIRPTSWDLATQGAMLSVAGIGVCWLCVQELWSALRGSHLSPANIDGQTIAPPPVAEGRVHKVELADALLLTAWIFGTMTFVGGITWMINGRGVFPIVPAAAILLCRAIDRTHSKISYAFLEYWPLVPAAVITLIVTHADYSFARTQKLAAETMSRIAKKEGVGLWFTGHWGLQYYLEAAGAKPVHEKMGAMELGDLFVLPLNNDVYIKAPPQSVFVNRYRFLMSSWASTHQPSRCTGFYSDSWGVLPFALGPELNFDLKEASIVRENPYDIYELRRLADRVIREPRKKAQPATAPK